LAPYNLVCDVLRVPVHGFDGVSQLQVAGLHRYGEVPKLSEVAPGRQAGNLALCDHPRGDYLPRAFSEPVNHAPRRAKIVGGARVVVPLTVCRQYAFPTPASQAQDDACPSIISNCAPPSDTPFLFALTLREAIVNTLDED
jgi:hypothetical protein